MIRVLLGLLAALWTLAPGKAPFFRQPTEEGGMTALGLKLAGDVRRLVLLGADTPRSRATGISAIGISGGWHPCFAFLVRHLIEGLRVNAGGDQWASVVGTLKHAFFDAQMKKEPGRWILGKGNRVNLGGILSGEFDGIDLETRTLFDFKSKSPDAIRKIRDGEPPTLQNYGQGSAYAVAWNREGREPQIENVALIFLPRAFDLRDLYVWTGPVDEPLVDKGLERIELAFDVADELGLWDWAAQGPDLDDRLAEVPITPGSCMFCPFYAPDLDRASRWGCPGKEVTA